jgi:drug/metabolite transporter (DMT)-like permease
MGGSQAAAVVLAAAAALSFACANVLQQRIAVRLPSGSAFDLAVLARLARRPLWLLGVAMVLVAFGLQAAALGTGRLVVIEPVLASALLFALVIAAWAEGRRMRAGEWLAALATFGGLAAFLAAARPTGGLPTASASLLGLAVAAAAVLVAACAVLAIRLAPARRALLLGIGGGCGAGVTDALTKSVATLTGARWLGVFADPRLYLLAVVGLLTYTVQQNGYRAASLAAFLPAFAVLEPVIGSLLGLLVYHERLGGGPAVIAVDLAAGLAAAWGIARLAGYSADSAASPEEQAQPTELAAAAEDA